MDDNQVLGVGTLKDVVTIPIPVYPRTEEDSLPTIRDCHLAKAVWLKLALKSKVNPTGSNVIPRSRVTRWECPNFGSIKLNSDKGLRNNIATASALLHDDKGNWIVGFSQKIGSCLVFEAKMWGLFTGLQLAWSLGF
ncbi:hypothetical protein RCOM_1636500 [Ricinus communis]|uniref:RNase H type-1 domain-containing protein n=1 Tax=Ricinus communis TaxID=3988 RepID=B9RU98_RICCO|nr:hypothetical protein RCOM_1636500 [Ricinus communis]